MQLSILASDILSFGGLYSVCLEACESNRSSSFLTFLIASVGNLGMFHMYEWSEIVIHYACDKKTVRPNLPVEYIVITSLKSMELC